MINDIIKSLVEEFTISRGEYLKLLRKEILYDNFINLLKAGCNVDILLKTIELPKEILKRNEDNTNNIQVVCLKHNISNCGICN